MRYGVPVIAVRDLHDALNRKAGVEQERAPAAADLRFSETGVGAPSHPTRRASPQGKDWKRERTRFYAPAIDCINRKEELERRFNQSTWKVVNHDESRNDDCARSRGNLVASRASACGFHLGHAVCAGRSH